MYGILLSLFTLHFLSPCMGYFLDSLMNLTAKTSSQLVTPPTYFIHNILHFPDPLQQAHGTVLLPTGGFVVEQCLIPGGASLLAKTGVLAGTD
ncbi:hypothetical protein BKA64DRAFT_43184 [Cadophora sp. MPI-SDFR-AT-0126]|nr:hypothetical protein BKA64DRAFT_43184 [Leotiomycetes sp. MPI-SDFR-AT-0126]